MSGNRSSQQWNRRYKNKKKELNDIKEGRKGDMEGMKKRKGIKKTNNI